MLARLWWKEYRVFGPVWLILGLAAALLQWLFLTAGSQDARSGGLTVAALCWAVLYAFAVGAAAFAGERDSETLGFLDALPVSRPTLWIGKATFALASTFGLALALAGLAALGTETRDPVERYSYTDVVRVFGTLLFEAVAWGLLWSSLSKNPLLAGVMAVLSMYASAFAMDRLAAPGHLLASNDFVAPDAVPARLLAAFAALAASALVISRRPGMTGSSRSRKAPDRTGPIEIRASSTGRSLAWQAWREGRVTWLFVAMVGLVMPLGMSLVGFPGETLMDLLLAFLASLVAGVSVFGTENASGARRFLAHHGVAPGTVWWRKVLVWGAGMASLLVLMALSFLALGAPFGGPEITAIGRPAERLVLLVVGVVNAFAVGALCGMTIRRRVTAAMVGVILVIALVPLQVGLVYQEMVPAWTLILVPSILLAISRAWADDWLFEREGARPWLKLGCLVVVPFGLLAASYIAYRALGEPDVGPVAASASGPSGAIPPDQDAAEMYRRATRMVRAERGFLNAENGRTSAPLEGVIEGGWDPDQAAVVDYWEKNRPAIDLARTASAMPQARFEPAGPTTRDATQEQAERGLGLLAQLLALDTRERLSRGDLPGAWDDILAQLRMASQLGSNTPTLTHTDLAAQIHHTAVGLAFDWLADARQSPEATRRALADLKTLPPMPDLTECLRVEASILERMLDLPGDDLTQLLHSVFGARKRSGLGLLFYAKVIASPWERLRARRICRRLIAEEIPIVAAEPWRRGPTADLSDHPNPDFQGSTLARMLLPSFKAALDRLDRESVGRRALEQAVALVAWKLDHGGKYPETLEALVPGLLDRLPIDPYSGRTFGYRWSEREMIVPPIDREVGPPGLLRASKPRRILLHSVGPVENPKFAVP